MTYRKMAVAVVVLCLSLPSLATGITSFSFNLGTFVANTNRTVIGLIPSVLISVTGGPCPQSCIGQLGGMTFITGALISGSLAKGGIFGPGGMLTITGNGMHGVPSGVLFQGTFTAATWTLTKLPRGDVFAFVGEVIGTGKFSGILANTVQSSILVGSNPFLPNGTGRVASSGGSLSAGVAPEPGSLTLMGTGILGIAAGIRYRRRLWR